MIKSTLLTPLAITVLLAATVALAVHDGLPVPLRDWLVRDARREVALASPALTDAQAVHVLQDESAYIVCCSYSNASAGAHPTADGYGALNDYAVGDQSPDWVAVNTGAVAALSLMRAAAFLHARGEDMRAEDAALDAYFDVWMVRHRQGWVADAHSADAGGMAARVYYNAQGRHTHSDNATPEATGMALVAMWKHGEYLADTGRTAEARAWLRRAWPVARPAGEYLRAHFDPQTGLEEGPAGSPDEWLTDAVAADDGLACLDKWAQALGRSDPDDASMAARLTAGIAAMRQDDFWAGYYRLRDHNKGGRPADGDSVDQLGFLPYEANVLDPADPFVRRISDGWTEGRSGIRMTAQTDDPRVWTYYGTHWHHYFSNRPENEELFPGPGLQLAKVEWRYGQRVHDRVVSLRALNRLRWVVGPQYSGLWPGTGGVIDWRDEHNHRQTAADWERFIDTSGYLIQAVLLIQFHMDTPYVPEDGPPEH